MTGLWFVLWRIKRYLRVANQNLHSTLISRQRRTEAIVGLNVALRPIFPIPELQMWSITPHFANILMNNIGMHNPRAILECGSGVSTLIMAYCLARTGNGHIYALEHIESYAKSTQELLKLHGMTTFATVIHAPLLPVTRGSETLVWYDISGIEKIDCIDMVIVDGPPGTGSPMARYPVIPLLADKLSSDAIILLDDYDRPDERNSVKLWSENFGFSHITELKVERGVCIVRKPGIMLSEHV
jgi:predicted O-methyltransferase YrrM